MKDEQAFEVSQKRNYSVVEHNSLAQQQYITKRSKGNSLTLAEEKALAYLVSRITPSMETIPPLEFDIKEYCSVCGLNADKYYSHLKGILSKLGGRFAWLRDSSGKEYGWPYFEEVMLDQGNGTGHVIINKKLEPYFIRLSGNFLQFSLHNILAMKTVHGIQLYKLLKSLYFKGDDIEFELELLKGHLDCIEKYPDIKDFKRRVINPALADINKYSDLEVTAEYKKAGRKITHIVFHVFDLSRCLTPAEIEEATQRIRNTERELNRNQMTFPEFDSVGDYPI